MARWAIKLPLSGYNHITSGLFVVLKPLCKTSFRNWPLISSPKCTHPDCVLFWPLASPVVRKGNNPKWRGGLTNYFCPFRLDQLVLKLKNIYGVGFNPLLTFLERGVWGEAFFFIVCLSPGLPKRRTSAFFSFFSKIFFLE